MYGQEQFSLFYVTTVFSVRLWNRLMLKPVMNMVKKLEDIWLKWKNLAPFFGLQARRGGERAWFQPFAHVLKRGGT